jgi:hypothetical protein
MKSASPPIVGSATPVIASEPVLVQQHKIPLAAKVAVNQDLYVILWLGALWLWRR